MPFSIYPPLAVGVTLFGGTHRSRPTDGYRFRVPFIQRGRWVVAGLGGAEPRPYAGFADAVFHLSASGGKRYRVAGRRRQRHPAKNERMVEPVPLG